MAVTSVTHLKQLESGVYSVSDRTYTRVYQVVCAATDTVPTILTASAGGTTIPLIGAAHPNDAGAKAIRVGPPTAVGDSRTVWQLPVEYARPRFCGTEETPEEDPLDDPVRKTWGVRFIQQVAEKDKDDVAIVNAAGEPFDPPLEKDVAILTLRIERNEATFSESQAFDYANTVNSTGCTIAGLILDARQARCLGITADYAQRNAVNYWAVTYEFEFRPDRWDRKVLNVGYHYLDGGELTPFADTEEGKMQTPQRLTGAGADGRGAAANYVTVYVYDERNFNTLNLGGV